MINEQISSNNNPNEDFYDVIFSGEIKESGNIELVKENLARFYKIPISFVEILFIGGMTLLIRENANYQVAEERRRIFERLGAICYTQSKQSKDYHKKQTISWVKNTPIIKSILSVINKKEFRIRALIYGTLLLLAIWALFLFRTFFESPQQGFQSFVKNVRQEKWDKVYDRFSERTEKYITNFVVNALDDNQIENDALLNLSDKEIFVLVLEKYKDKTLFNKFEFFRAKIGKIEEKIRIQDLDVTLIVHSSDDKFSKEIRMIKEENKWKVDLFRSEFEG